MRIQPVIPHWARGPTISAKLSNARGETGAEKPSFRDAFERRRCLVPADGFYEWKAEGRIKQPYYFSMKSCESFALGGVWESWRVPDGSILRTCCLITTGPNDIMLPVHDRMPVIVSPADHDACSQESQRMRWPITADVMQTWAVNTRVSWSVEEGTDPIKPLT